MTARLRNGGEAGMTVVEVMVAAMILVIGALALLGLVDTTARSTYRAEQSQVVSNRLQQEMERVRQLDYEQVALTAIPADTTNLKDPRWRVSGTQYAAGKDGSQLRPLVYDGSPLYEGGQVELEAGHGIDPGPIPFSSGDVSGLIYRFVVWEDDASCPEAQCPGSQDLKRVIVAVRLNDTASGGERAYQEIHAQLVDPDVLPIDNENPLPPGDDQGHPWILQLTDTSCDNATRQPLVADHPTHNTRGVCSTGPTSGNTPGAPDLLYDAPPLFNPESPLYDYATDVEPPLDPGADKGLQVLRANTAGCPSYAMDIASSPEDEGDRFQKVHKWVSPPIPDGFDIELNGLGTLSLWTQTVNATVHQAKICVWVFIRSSGETTDTPATNQDPPLAGAGHFTYEQPSWPTGWTEIHLPLNFTLTQHLLPGDRLGLAVSVDSTTAGDGLQFMYDEPSYDSRLEVKTSSQLPTF